MCFFALFAASAQPQIQSALQFYQPLKVAEWGTAALRTRDFISKIVTGCSRTHSTTRAAGLSAELEVLLYCQGMSTETQPLCVPRLALYTATLLMHCESHCYRLVGHTGSSLTGASAYSAGLHLGFLRKHYTTLRLNCILATALTRCSFQCLTSPP